MCLRQSYIYTLIHSQEPKIRGAFDEHLTKFRIVFISQNKLVVYCYMEQMMGFQYDLMEMDGWMTCDFTCSWVLMEKI